MKRKLWQKLSAVILVAVMLMSCAVCSSLIVSAAGSNFTNASKINVNQTYTDSISSWNEKDYFKFTLSSASKVSINFQHDYIDSSSTYWVMEIYNNNQKFMHDMYIAGSTVNMNSYNLGLPSGNYYIVVSAYSSSYWSDKDYLLKVNSSATDYWEKEFNNEYSTATTITLNTVYKGVTTNYKDKDYYKFSLSSPSKINVNFKHDEINSSSTYWEVNIYSIDGNMDGHYINGFNVSGNKINTTSCNIGLPAGNYYIIVSPCSSSYWSGKDYSLKVSSSATNYWEKEFNNMYSTSTQIALNKEYHGTTMSYQDNDYYKFSLSSPSKINVNFKHDEINSSSTYWEVNIYSIDSNMDGYYINGFRISGNKINTTSCNIGLPKGNYYIVVSPYSSSYWSSKDYSLTVNSSATDDWEQEFNNMYSTGNKIVLNKEYHGTTMSYQDNDYYQFSLSNTSKINLNFKHNEINNSSNYWEVYIYSMDSDYNSNKIYGFYVPGNKTSLITPDFNLNKGNYYIVISAYSSSYYSTMDYSFTVSGPSTTVAPTSVSLDKTSLSLNKGGTYTVKATVAPSNATNKTVTWTTSNSNVATVSGGKITATGVGTATITAKTSNGKTATCKVTIVNQLTNNSTLSATSITLGQTITAKGAGTGGTTPYQYQVLYKQTSQTNWTTAQAYKANATVTFKPAVATTYDVCVKVKDSKGTESKKFFTVTVKKSALANNSTLSATSITLGQTITAKGAGTGGTTPYQYQVLYKQNSQTNWTTVQAYKTNAAVTFKPATATTYDVCVKIKDNIGTIVKKFFTVTIKKSTLANTSTISSTSIKYGSTFTMKCSASGGSGTYTYAVLYKKDYDTNWTVKQNYSTNKTVTIKPAKATKYNVCVKAKDSLGTIVKKYFSVTVK